MNIIRETSGFIVEEHPTKRAFRITDNGNNTTSEWIPCDTTISELYEIVSAIPLPEFREWCMNHLYEEEFNY